jgi:hypothetical protein
MRQRWKRTHELKIRPGQIGFGKTFPWVDKKIKTEMAEFYFVLYIFYGVHPSSPSAMAGGGGMNNASPRERLNSAAFDLKRRVVAGTAS